MENKLVSGIVDTGSSVTLVKSSSVPRLGLTVNYQRPVPSLRAANNLPVPVKGMVAVHIKVGADRTQKVWACVVPDSFINRDVLLGWNILKLADLKWHAKTRVLEWGGHFYDVCHVKSRINRIVMYTKEEKRAQSPKTSVDQNAESSSLQLRHRVTMKPYQSRVVQVKTAFRPGTPLVVTPAVRVSKQITRMLVQVDSQQRVPVVVENATKRVQVLKPGVNVAQVEIAQPEWVEEPLPVRTTSIVNELLPPVEGIPGETRSEKLRFLVQQQEWAHLEERQRDELAQLVLRYHELFVVEDRDLGRIAGPEVKIEVKDPVPCRTHPYRYPETAKQIIGKMLDEMEEKGIIEASNAAWLSPIVLVAKPDGSKRMCLDFRKVNTHLAADVHPLPRLEDLVNSASGYAYYATLDLKEAYHQVVLEEGSRDLTTFSDGVSLYRFKRLPFGLSCAPAIFARKMAEVLAPIVKRGWVRNYLDDVIIMANTPEELLGRLRQVFDTMHQSGVKLNLKKCDLVKREVKFLGHIVSAAGSRPDPGNVKAIQNMSPPKTVKEVRRFIGMTSFYRKYVPDFSLIAAPITQLTKSDQKFKWTDQCQSAFLKLKQKLVSPPVLVRYRNELPLQLVTDASDDCVGAVLHQVYPDGRVQPLGYYSKKLNGPETRYSVTDKEALAVVFACRHFHHFLWGRSFEVYTDHRPLLTIFTQKSKSPRVTRWMLEMREYQYRIKYIKGTKNVVADQLSRPVAAITVQEPQVDWLGVTKTTFIEKQQEEGVWKELVGYLTGQQLPGKKIPRATLDQFSVKDGVLYYIRQDFKGNINYCPVVPRSLTKKASELAHDTQGHFGQFKSIKMAERDYYWPTLRQDISEYVQKCRSCQQCKIGKSLSYEYSELPEVTRPLERIAIDIVDLVSGQDGYRYTLTVIDHHSRFVQFYQLRTKGSVGIVKSLEHYVSCFGIPESVLLDNAAEFSGVDMAEWSSEKGVKLYYTTPYHPQANGMVERMHRTMKQVLRQLCEGFPHRWPGLLQKCATLMNASVHTSTGTTPFTAFHQRSPHRGSLKKFPTIVNPDSDTTKMRAMISKASERSRARYRKIANRKKKKEKVGEGALVWVKAHRTTPNTSTKLNPKWRGPYKVVKRVHDGVAYVLENVFTGVQIERAPDQVRVYVGDGDIVVQMEEQGGMVDDEEDEMERDLPPRTRHPPRRLIESV